MSEDERIGVVIATHDRVDDAMVNQELVRNVWGVDPQPVIVHAFNGEDEWYPEPHLEDELVRIPNNGHFRGAGELIDAGCAALAARGDVRYAIVLAADVWFLGGGYPGAIIEGMRSDGHRIAAAPWGFLDSNNPFGVGLATDHFIVDLPWAMEYGLFPLDYAEFDRMYRSITLYASAGMPSLEKLLMVRLMEAVHRETGRDAALMDDTLAVMRRMSEREPIHPINAGESKERREEWPEIGLIASHDAVRKREVLIQTGIPAEPGSAIERWIRGEASAPPDPGA